MTFCVDPPPPKKKDSKTLEQICCQPAVSNVMHFSPMSSQLYYNLYNTNILCYSIVFPNFDVTLS